MTAARLQVAMERANVGQSELARRLGVTPGAINQIATGRTRRSRLLPDISRELHVTVDWLRGLTDDPSADEATPQLTKEERRFIEIYRQLPKKDRAAMKLLLQRMAAESPRDD